MEEVNKSQGLEPVWSKVIRFTRPFPTKENPEPQGPTGFFGPKEDPKASLDRCFVGVFCFVFVCFVFLIDWHEEDQVQLLVVLQGFGLRHPRHPFHKNRVIHCDLHDTGGPYPKWYIMTPGQARD